MSYLNLFIMLLHVYTFTSCKNNNLQNNENKLIKNRFFTEDELRINNKCVFENAFIKYSENELTKEIEQALDSISIFLKANDNLKITIQCYSIDSPQSSTMTALKRQIH